jgi:hypothetical protein
MLLALSTYTSACTRERHIRSYAVLHIRLYTDTCKPNEEPESLARFLAELIVVGQQAGGVAPRPQLPDLQLVRDIEDRSGNERLLAAWDKRDQLRELHTEWQRRAKKIEERMEEWQKLEVLIQKGASLAEADQVREQMEAIVSNRSLLEDPNLVRPLVSRMTDAIRKALRAGAEEYGTAREAGLAELNDAPEFQGLSDQVWRGIIERCDLGPLPPDKLGSDDDVISAVERTPLATLTDRVEAMKGRVNRARRLLAEAVAPKVVSYSPPLRLLKTREEVEAYVDEVRGALMKAIKDGNPVNIGH